MKKRLTMAFVTLMREKIAACDVKLNSLKRESYSPDYLKALGLTVMDVNDILDILAAYDNMLKDAVYNGEVDI